MLHYFKKTNTDVTLDVIFVNFDIYMESRPYIVIFLIFWPDKKGAILQLSR